MSISQKCLHEFLKTFQILCQKCSACKWGNSWKSRIKLIFDLMWHKIVPPDCDSDIYRLSGLNLCRLTVRPTRNKNCLWRPCLLSNCDEMCNLYRGLVIDASYPVLVYLPNQFQRRRFLEIDQSETRIAYGCHVW